MPLNISNPIRNGIALVTSRAVSMIIPLITLPFLASKLGTEGFGHIAFGLTFAVLLETYLRFGLDLIAIRDGSKLISSNKDINSLFSRVFFTRLTLLFPGLIATLLFVFFLDVSPVQRNIVVLNIALACINSFNNDWVFQAHQQMLFLAFFNLIAKSLYVVIIFSCIATKADILYEPLAFLLGALLNTIMSNVIIARRFEVRLQFVKASEILGFVKAGYGLFTASLLPNLYTTLSYLYLERAGPHSVGIFSGGFRIISVVESINQIGNKVFYPELSQNPNYFKRFLVGGIIVSSVLSILLTLSAPAIIEILLGNEFTESVEILKIMGFAPLVLFVMLAFGQNFLVLNGQEKRYSNIVTSCSIVGGLVAYFLTEELQANGAAIAIMLTWTARAFMSALASRKTVAHD